ncbi:MAG: cytochrome C [Deltaproteobacteria bacterium]|nr:cytochrome C [Deltaproteobacteria bacterium]
MNAKHLCMVLLCCALISGLSVAAQATPSVPTLCVQTFGTKVYVSWNVVEGLSKYVLSYAPAPYTGPASIASADMGGGVGVWADLWPGASFYLAVQSSDGVEMGNYSNIEYFALPASGSDAYQVFAFNDLGMHCYDSDFSVFSVLPLFNVLHAQVVQKGDPPRIVGDSVDVMYKSLADPSGSINTTSIGKTNFWDYVFALFGLNPPPDEGVLGARMPGAGNAAQPFAWANGPKNWFSAEGIPITAFDDNSQLNSYALMNVQASNPADGTVLSSLPVVIPASDEVSCDACHLTGQVAAALSGIAWSRNSDPSRQSRENILLLHDFRNGTNLFNNQPVLCSACHYSLALDLAQQGPQGPQLQNPYMSRAVHNWHASRITEVPPSGNVCFYCHPGEKTQCARGAMDTAGLVCLDCHGNLFAVGRAGRQPWIDLPKCQSCHTGDALNNVDGQMIRRTAYTDSPNVATPIVATNQRFAEQTDTLFRNSLGHSGVACESCHGSPHAIWPSREANDNLAATRIQGHDGMIIECTACHGSELPLTLQGPHGMHNVNSPNWVYRHEEIAGQQACGTCHGADGNGTVLSKAAANRTFSVEEEDEDNDRATVGILKGTQIGCGLCHENKITHE